MAAVHFVGLDAESFLDDAPLEVSGEEAVEAAARSLLTVKAPA